MVSNGLSLNCCYLKIIHIFYRFYHTKIIGHTLKIKQKDKCVCINELMRLIIMKIKKKKKNRSHRYDINRPRSRNEHKVNIRRASL